MKKSERNKNIKKNTSKKQKRKENLVENKPLGIDIDISEGNEISDEFNISEELDEEVEKGLNIVNSHNEKLIEDRQERIYENKNIKKKEKNDIRYKVRPILIGTIIVVIIGLIYAVFEYGPIFGININKNSGISEESKIDIITSESDIYKMYNQELLIYSNNSVSTYNNFCQKTWSYNLTENFTPNIYINNEYMAIANNSNGTIYMFENKKEIFNKKIEGVIEDIYIDNYGNIAVEYSTTGYKKVIGVYDRKGKSKFDTYLSTGTLIDVKMIENCTKLLLVQVESNTFKVGINLSIVDPTKESDNITEICKFDNALLYDIEVQGQSAILLLDSKIVTVNLTNGNISEIKSFDENQMLFTAIYKDYYIYLEKELNKESDGYTISTIQYNGTEISSLKVQNSPKLLYNSGLLNYFIYTNSLQVVNKWGIEVKNIPLDFIPKEIVIFNNEKSIGLIYTNKIYIINI